MKRLGMRSTIPAEARSRSFIKDEFDEKKLGAEIVRLVEEGKGNRQMRRMVAAMRRRNYR